MVDIWLPGYDRWELPGVPGFAYDEWDDPKALLHMTQGTSIEGAVQAYKSYPPHTCVRYATREKKQHIPLNRAAYALWNADADDSRCYQVEIVGYSESAPNLSDAELKWLGEEVLLPLHEYGGVPLVVVWKGFKSPADVDYILASASSPLRLTQAELDSFAGILGHQHIPGDNHWDPGGLRVGRMVEHAKNKKEDFVDSAQEDRIAYKAAEKTVSLLLDGVDLNRTSDPDEGPIGGIFKLRWLLQGLDAKFRYLKAAANAQSDDEAKILAAVSEQQEQVDLTTEQLQMLLAAMSDASKEGLRELLREGVGAQQ